MEKSGLALPQYFPSLEAKEKIPANLSKVSPNCVKF